MSQKKAVPLEITLLLLNARYFTSGNLNELNMNSESISILPSSKYFDRVISKGFLKGDLFGGTLNIRKTDLSPCCVMNSGTSFQYPQPRFTRPRI